MRSARISWQTLTGTARFPAGSVDAAQDPSAVFEKGDLAGALRAAFEEARGGAAFAERFDHATAWIYAEAEDPELRPGQRAQIQELLRRWRQAMSPPFADAYEEPDPHYGAVTLATLTSGDYGLFKLVNQSDDRISTRPAALPPMTIHIHLCWLVGLGAVEARVTPAKTAGVKVSGASMAAGLTLLLLDDWRVALRRLPIRFHLHRLGPRQLWRGRGEPEFELGRGGWRWRQRQHRTLPPASVIGLSCERVGAADVARDPHLHNSGEGRGVHHWWVAVICDSDLPGLGFRGADLGCRTAPETRLPRHLSHLVTPPGSQHPGGVWRVDRGGGRCSLVPLGDAQPVTGEASRPDVSCLDLRASALDAALDEMTARMS